MNAVQEMEADVLSEVIVWFAATRDKRGPQMLKVFLLLVVLAVLIWNIIP
jgi:hypothetical protein